jgi:hypothetical protein
MWRESGAGEPPDEKGRQIWRASLVSTLTGKRRGFANLDDLFCFLRQHEIELLDRHPQDHQSEEGGNSLAATGG